MSVVRHVKHLHLLFMAFLFFAVMQAAWFEKPAQALMAAPVESSAQKNLMVFGDSLSSGYGLPFGESMPTKLEAALKQRGYDIRVTNAGVTGDTTASGLKRLHWVLKQDPDYVILALGGNDMLRAVNPAVTAKNLRAMLQLLKDKEKPVLLAGMRSLSNLGPAYAAQYIVMYQALAEEFDTVYYPFLLEGVALDPVYNQHDGVHPNVAGVAVIVANILPYVEKLLAIDVE